MIDQALQRGDAWLAPVRSALVELVGPVARLMVHLAHGSAGVWLLSAGAVGLLLAAWAWRWPAVHDRGLSGSPWRAGLMGAGLSGALACLVLAAVRWSDAHPSQRVAMLVLGGVLAGHGLWMLAAWSAVVTGARRLEALCLAMRRHRAAYYLILPAVTLMAIFNYAPMARVVATSLTSHQVGGEAQWVGLDNYIRLAGDPIFWLSMRHLAMFVLCQLALSLTVPFLVAELVFHLRRERTRYWLRTLFLVPVVVPSVVIHLIWQFLYSDAGPIALLGHALGLGDAAEGLLARPGTALAAVIFVGFPFVNGINLLLFYAGLANVPQSVWEAARLDGAGLWRRLWTIDLPMLARQYRLVSVLTVIGAVQAFENVLVMTQGGPGWQTMLPGLYMYRSAMSFNEFGYACAMGMCLFMMALLMTVALGRLWGRREDLP